MEIEEKNETQDLTKKIGRINEWIKDNPNVIDPNVYEIMDCNVSLAEMLSEYAKVDGAQDLQSTSAKHKEIEPCYFELVEIDTLRDTENHPFFQIPEVNALYCEVKKSLIFMSYDVPKDIAMKKIKKELLCKSMSVPFYIWQVHRNEPDYQYDNATEFDAMKDMLATYKAYGNTQFVPQIESLFGIIERNYKYSTSENISKHV